MANSSVRDLTKGSPMKLILGFMLPLFFGILFQQFYNMVDTVVVGRYVGLEALAGVGSTGAINFLVVGFVIGTSAGFAIPVAQKFGSKDYAALKKYVGNTLWISIVFAAVLTAATCILCGKILEWMNTPEDVFMQAYNYIFVIFLGIPITFSYNILSGFIRSLGDSRTPVIFLVISSLLNIALDIFMIVALNMGVAGAGVATVVSQAFSSVLCLIYIIKRMELLHLSKSDIKPDFKYIGRLCAAGLPMGLQYSITAIGAIILQTAVNGLGAVYMASLTAGNKVGQFMCCPFDAMGSTIATYGGQNIGAGELKRVKRGLLDCVLLGTIWAIVALVIVTLFGGDLAALFLDESDPETAENIGLIRQYSSHFLIINSFFYIPLALVNIVRFMIQGMGYSQIALYAGVFELAARGIVALALVPVFGFEAICYANPLAWVLADLFLIPAFFVCYNSVKKKLNAAELRQE